MTKVTVNKEEMVEMVAEQMRQEQGIPAQLKAAQKKINDRRKAEFDSQYGRLFDFSPATVNDLENRVKDVIKQANNALDEIQAFRKSGKYTATDFVNGVNAVFGNFNIQKEALDVQKIADEVLKLKTQQEAEMKLLVDVIFSEEYMIYCKAHQFVNGYVPEYNIYKGDEIKVDAVMTNRWRKSESLEATGVVSYVTDEYFTLTVTEGTGKRAKKVSYDLLRKHDLESIKYNVVKLELVKRDQETTKYISW